MPPKRNRSIRTLPSDKLCIKYPPVEVPLYTEETQMSYFGEHVEDDMSPPFYRPRSIQRGSKKGRRKGAIVKTPQNSVRNTDTERIIESMNKVSLNKSLSSSPSWSEDYDTESKQKVQDELEHIDRIFSGVDPIPSHYDVDEYKLWMETFPNLRLCGDATNKLHMDKAPPTTCNYLCAHCWYHIEQYILKNHSSNSKTRRSRGDSIASQDNLKHSRGIFGGQKQGPYKMVSPSNQEKRYRELFGLPANATTHFRNCDKEMNSALEKYKLEIKKAVIHKIYENIQIRLNRDPYLINRHRSKSIDSFRTKTNSIGRSDMELEGNCKRYSLPQVSDRSDLDRGAFFKNAQFFSKWMKDGSPEYTSLPFLADETKRNGFYLTHRERSGNENVKISVVNRRKLRIGTNFLPPIDSDNVSQFRSISATPSVPAKYLSSLSMQVESGGRQISTPYLLGDSLRQQDSAALKKFFKCESLNK